MGKYEPTLNTVDLWPGVTEDVGSLKHCRLIDQIAAIRGPEDEEILRLLKNGCTQADIAEVMGIGQQHVSERYRALLKRANGRGLYRR